MLSSSKLRQNLFFLYLPKLLTFVLLAVLSWMLAKWTWLIVAPRASVKWSAPGPSADLIASRSQITTSGLFTSPKRATPQETSTPTALNLQLAGVLAAKTKGLQSLAILNLNNKGNEVFRVGSEITTGVVLDHITRTHVVIRRQGNLERVEFPNSMPGAKASPVTTSGFKLQVPQQASGQFSFSRQDLNNALQEPGQLAQLGRLTIKPGGGVIIEQAPPGSLAQKLSLQDGDVITSINRETVSSTEDLLRLYQKFSNTGQVTLEGSRRDAPLKQTYTVKP